MHTCKPRNARQRGADHKTLDLLLDMKGFEQFTRYMGPGVPEGDKPSWKQMPSIGANMYFALTKTSTIIFYFAPPRTLVFFSNSTGKFNIEYNSQLFDAIVHNEAKVLAAVDNFTDRLLCVWRNLLGGLTMKIKCADHRIFQQEGKWFVKLEAIESAWIVAKDQFEFLVYHLRQDIGPHILGGHNYQPIRRLTVVVGETFHPCHESFDASKVKADKEIQVKSGHFRLLMEVGRGLNEFRGWVMDLEEELHTIMEKNGQHLSLKMNAIHENEENSQQWGSVWRGVPTTILHQLSKKRSNWIAEFDSSLKEKLRERCIVDVSSEDKVRFPTAQIKERQAAMCQKTIVYEEFLVSKHHSYPACIC